MDPSLARPIQSDSNPESGANVPPDCERATTLKSDDVTCEGDGVGESSNIVRAHHTLTQLVHCI